MLHFVSPCAAFYNIDQVSAFRVDPDHTKHAAHGYSLSDVKRNPDQAISTGVAAAMAVLKQLIRRLSVRDSSSHRQMLDLFHFMSLAWQI